MQYRYCKQATAFVHSHCTATGTVHIGPREPLPILIWPVPTVRKYSEFLRNYRYVHQLRGPDKWPTIMNVFFLQL
jgi:hypothetical protein